MIQKLSTQNTAILLTGIVKSIALLTSFFVLSILLGIATIQKAMISWFILSDVTIFGYLFYVFITNVIYLMDPATYIFETCRDSYMRNNAIKKYAYTLKRNLLIIVPSLHQYCDQTLLLDEINTFVDYVEMSIEKKIMDSSSIYVSRNMRDDINRGSQAICDLINCHLKDKKYRFVYDNIVDKGVFFPIIITEIRAVDKRSNNKQQYKIYKLGLPDLEQDNNTSRGSCDEIDDVNQYTTTTRYNTILIEQNVIDEEFMNELSERLHTDTYIVTTTIVDGTKKQYISIEYDDYLLYDFIGIPPNSDTIIDILCDMCDRYSNY